MNIITLSNIEGSPAFEFLDKIIDIYKEDKTLFKNNDTSLSHLTEAGNNFNDYCSNPINLKGRTWTVDCNIRNRLGSDEFNNTELHFIEEDPYWGPKLKINCFKKYENGKIEINDDYNSKSGQIINADALINEIINFERNINENNGHITFIILACRGFHPSMSDDEKAMVRTKSNVTNNKIEASKAHDKRYNELLKQEQSEEEAYEAQSERYKELLKKEQSERYKELLKQEQSEEEAYKAQSERYKELLKKEQSKEEADALAHDIEDIARMEAKEEADALAHDIEDIARIKAVKGIRNF